MSETRDPDPRPAPEIVTTEEELRRAVDLLSRSSRIALDIEGDGFFRYRARLCTAQISDGAHTFIVDTLALGASREGVPAALAPLAELLAPTGPQKILHDSAFDTRILHEHGFELGNVFDTATAARFLGESASGLGSLVEKYFGIRLDKEQQQADWGRRPFSDEALHYLEQDVAHLHGLAELIEGKVAAAGIEREVAEETRYAMDSARMEPNDDRPPWRRIKGWEKLKPEALSILREVCLAREVISERKDKPPFRILSNMAILNIATQAPKGLDDLRRVKAVGQSIRYGSEILTAVKKGRHAGAVPETELPVREAAPPPEERQWRRQIQKRLTHWRNKEAERREVDPQVVLPGHCLRDLVALAKMPTTEDPEPPIDLTQIRGFGAVRLERYGDVVPGLLRDSSG
ncbi:MAG: HRDC domain-containing protein, partial [Myxococcales bacterium]|nr:HRDC domain-containing protein [Myxococcales bacterium]